MARRETPVKTSRDVGSLLADRSLPLGGQRESTSNRGLPLALGGRNRGVTFERLRLFGNEP